MYIIIHFILLHKYVSSTLFLCCFAFHIIIIDVATLYFQIYNICVIYFYELTRFTMQAYNILFIYNIYVRVHRQKICTFCAGVKKMGTGMNQTMSRSSFHYILCVYISLSLSLCIIYLIHRLSFFFLFPSVSSRYYITLKCTHKFFGLQIICIKYEDFTHTT